MMTDSDSDGGLSNTVFTFQNQTQKIHVKGPQGNRNISSLSFRNNSTLTSTVNVPWNTVRPRYAESVCDVRRYRRDTSPTMSLHSASGLQARSLYQPGLGSARSMYNARGGSPSQSMYNVRGGSQSVYNGRSRSPTSHSVYNPTAVSPTTSMRSFRTVDTNATMLSAIDIASALQNSKFSKVEARILRDACNKYIKRKVRSRVEKRRAMRKFKNQTRRRSGGDSGDVSSDSSSDKSYRTSRTALSSLRSNNTDFVDIRKIMNESNMYKNSTNNFKQNTLRGLCPPRSTNIDYQPRITSMPQDYTFGNSLVVPHRDRYTGSSSRSVHGVSRMQREPYEANSSRMTQKERFETGFQLPCQRFQSTKSLPSTSKAKALQTVEEDSILTANARARRQDSFSSTSEHESIFLESTGLQNDRTQNQKRYREHDDVVVPSKKSKLSSPQKTNAIPKPSTPKQKNSAPSAARNSNDFVFAKPQFPISRLVKAKNTEKKKLQPTPGKQLPKSPIPPQITVTKPTPISPKKPQNTVTKPTPKSPKQPQNTITKSTRKQPHNTIEKQTQNTASKQQKTKTPKKSKNTPKQMPEILVSSNLAADILISKSAQPLDGPEPEPVPVTKATTQHAKESNQSVLTQNTTDLSMRPSFIKRKLFSHKVDILDKSSSSDNLQAASPSNLYSAIQKEKNRARKIVASQSQSCMSRDILGNESNLLDLIHKIVPPDRMSVTSATNRSEMQTSKTSRTTRDTNDWDDTNVITKSKDDDNISESFTDEEIFNKTVVDNNHTVTQDRVNKTRNHKNDNPVKQNAGSTKTAPYTARPCLVQTTPPQKKVGKEQHPTAVINGSTKTVPYSERKCLDQTTQPEKIGKEPNASTKINDEKAKPNSKESVSKISKPRNRINKNQISNTNISSIKQTHNRRSEMLSSGEKEAVSSFNDIVRKTVKLFWDSDFESDIEPDAKTPQKSPECRKAEELATENVAQMTKNSKAVLNNATTNTTKGLQKESSLLGFNKVPRVSIEKTHIKTSDKIGSHKNDRVGPKTDSTKNKPSTQENLAGKRKTAITTFKSRKTEFSEKENSAPNNITKEAPQKLIKDIVTKKSKFDSKIDDKKSKTIKVNNNTIRFHSNNNEESYKTLDESSDAHYKLRSRDVDLSNIMNSNTTKTIEKPILKKAAIKKNLKKANSKEKSQVSEPSFTLTSDETLRSRKHLLDITRSIQTRKRKSDVSFTLLSDKTITKTVSRADSKTKASSKHNGSRELLALRDISLSMPRAAKRTPVRPKPYIIQH